ncbi:MAG TPA: tRNA (adenosine(37)-N6)-threonylcarbamoyltransferase complex dimerization subunit type 1 TsaB [Chthonomonadaceae bacterium]|nr:tRNA (adenosine(37)-N6)-threonylcarbamoyltransferase complex dimerization subunit type 1 TsaB [Chthonomonadaceae bacterium]
MAGLEEGVVLSLETSGDVCSVAVTRGRQFLIEHAFQHEMHLSERLMDIVNAALREAGVSLPEIALYAVGIGPGSFTGTRIGVMTAKTFAAVQEKPIVGVGGLEALAAEYAGVHKSIVVPMAPCRAGVVYTRPFRVESEVPEPLAEVGALSISDLAALLMGLPGENILCCGPAAARYAADLRQALPDAVHVTIGRAEFPRASIIARLAVDRLASGAPPDDPIALVPLYVSPPPITIPKSANRFQRAGP